MAFLAPGVGRGRVRHPSRAADWRRDLPKAAQTPAASSVLQQQARVDVFIERYNQERPHQTLAMKVPADVYRRSARVYRGLEDLTYPFRGLNRQIEDDSVSLRPCKTGYHREFRGHLPP